MSVNFDNERWDKVKDTYSKWWDGKLKRPIIPIELYDKNIGGKVPNAPILSQENCTDFSYSPKEIIDRLDFEFSRKTYLGDAFPYINMDTFGPGILAAFLGADVDNSTGRVWFHAKNNLPISELHFEYDQNSLYFKRIKDLYIAAMEKWNGLVLLGMPDFGGMLDILSTFRPGENLLYDLYDEPDEVKRVTKEIHNVWHKCFNELEILLSQCNPGYTNWSRIYSDKSFYILQCDFSYMIGPNMFDEFVKNDIESSCRELQNSFYHLDGKGELPHLDSLLTIKELDGVQWVPGDGSLPCECWSEVYKKIDASGKRMQVVASNLDALDKVISFTKNPGLIQQVNLFYDYSPELEKELKNRLNKYGIE